MPRNITVTFDDGSSHVYQNAPDDVTPESVTARAEKDFSKKVTHLDGGKSQLPEGGLSTAISDVNNAIKAGARNIALMPIEAASNVYMAATGGTPEQMNERNAQMQSSFINAPQTQQEKTIRDIVAYPFEKISQGAHYLGDKFTEASASDREQRLKNVGYTRDENGVLINPKGQPAPEQAHPEDIYGGAGVEILANMMAPKVISKGVGITAKSAQALGKTSAGQAIGGILDYASRIVKTPEQLAEPLVKQRAQEAVQRSDLTPEQIADEFSRIKAKGGTLADVSPYFSSDLATATRGSVEGEISARKVFKGQNSADQMAKELDSFGEGNVKDIINSEKERTRPKINELYAQAAKDSEVNGGAMPLRLQQYFNDDKGTISRLKGDIESNLVDKRLGGQEATPFDQIQSTAEALQDKINSLYRSGENKKARDIVILRKNFLKDADSELPTFAEARKTFAGQAALEEASKSGDTILKMPLDELPDYLSDLSPAEKSMALLSVKKSLMTKIENAPQNSNIVSKLFGKNGDAQRLRYLFDDQARADSFMKDLEDLSKIRETQAKVTSGSMTSRNTQQDANANLSIGGVADSVIKNKSQKAQEIANKNLAELYLHGTPETLRKIIEPKKKLSDLIYEKSNAPINPVILNEDQKRKAK